MTGRKRIPPRDDPRWRLQHETEPDPTGRVFQHWELHDEDTGKHFNVIRAVPPLLVNP